MQALGLQIRPHANIRKLEKDRAIHAYPARSSSRDGGSGLHPLFDAVRQEIDRIAEVAWAAYEQGYGRQIFRCKACVSTAMPLCHWPCSYYPNQGLGQVND
jgi:hypothetical protein